MAHKLFFVNQLISTRERLENAGYKCIHLFKNIYLVRKHSVYARWFSLYDICILGVNKYGTKR